MPSGGPTPRIEMSNSDNTFFVGAVLGDGAGDYHVWNGVVGTGVWLFQDY